MAGRPLQFEREAAVRIAMNEIWRAGYPGVTVNGLCQLLGITRSSFYHSFGSLDKLFDEVVEFYLTGAPAVLTRDRQDAETEGSAVETIRETFRVLCRMRGREKENKGCLLVNNLGLLEVLSAPARKTTLDAFRKSGDRTRLLLTQALEAGELPAETDVETLVNALQTLTIGINNVSKTIPSEQKLWAIATATLDGLGLQARS